ncbi:FkbM family methyltransferase [Actinoplanes sp. NPDC051475]|uniref:FkbM family methyltransferase n=1 Tax=Actinoplanes sp. NPDC051475 TaxID=3157225 RepID=UPI00344D0922
MSYDEVHRVQFDDGLECYATHEAEARFLHREIFQDDTYARWKLPDAPVVLDVGAGIGLFTLFIKRRHPRARVIAIEPAPQNAALLRRNMELHGLTGVTVHEVCLGARGVPAAPFTFFAEMPANSTRYPEQYDLQRELTARQFGADQAARMFAPTLLSVPVEPLSGLLRRDHPRPGPVDLVKIDVEGAERDVLAGIEPGDWARLRSMLVETSGHDGARAAVEEALRRHGLAVTTVPSPFMWPELEICNVTGRR